MSLFVLNPQHSLVKTSKFCCTFSLSIAKWSKWSSRRLCKTRNKKMSCIIIRRYLCPFATYLKHIGHLPGRELKKNGFPLGELEILCTGFILVWLPEFHKNQCKKYFEGKIKILLLYYYLNHWWNQVYVNNYFCTTQNYVIKNILS